MIVDTETANSIEQPLPYDIGYAICDEQGNIYLERSFIVAEIFLDMEDVVGKACFANKIPEYWDDIKNGTRIIKSIVTIRKQMWKDMKEYKVKKVGAYNMAFDKKALNNAVRYCLKSLIRWWFPFGTQFFCVWNMACQTVLNTTSYIKFAKKNGFVSKSNNVSTSAEACYSFLTNSPDFVESHTALEDVEIEIKIMADCYATNIQMITDIDPQCWRIPQGMRRELEVKEALR
ncbi:MAG: hypothetical protein LUC37_02765 [Prevotella sp.]|nr:hypothetical protein [Prevotella sp.]